MNDIACRTTRGPARETDTRSGGASASATSAACAEVEPRACDMPRERLRDAGPGALSDVELIVLLLGTGLPGHNVFDVARSLLARFGSLRAMLDAQQLRAAEPALRAGLRGGMRVPDDGVVYAPAVAAWLLAQPVAGRITTRLDAHVERVTRTGVQLAGGDTIDAAAVLVANGLEAAALLPGLPLQAKKGHLLITDRYPGTVRHQILELGYIKSAHNASGTSVAFNAQPRPTGQLLIGSSRQFDSVDPQIDAAVLARMLARAAHYMPGLPALNAIRAWTGFRPSTADGLPLIGPADHFADDSMHRSTWLATGHEGLGVTTALATGKLIAAQFAGVAAPIDAAPYLPSRFARRESSHD